MLSRLLSRAWWVFLIRGVLSILFGMLTYFRPGVTLAALVLLFGAFAMADGVLSVLAAISGRKELEHWWLVLLQGLVGIGVGVLTVVHPEVTAIALLFYIAVWAIARGVLEIAAAIRLRKEIEGEWSLVLAGIASVLFGVLLLAQPGAGALAVLWLIGAYAMLFGIVLIVLAFKARGFEKRLKEARA
jgi:uncharacterized membrane protein HdeD (DUF308 family)